VLIWLPVTKSYFWVPESVSTQWQREISSTLPGINPRSAYSRLGTVQAVMSGLHCSERAKYNVTLTLNDTALLSTSLHNNYTTTLHPNFLRCLMQLIYINIYYIFQVLYIKFAINSQQLGMNKLNSIGK